jgi:hypothetical protein
MGAVVLGIKRQNRPQQNVIQYESFISDGMEFTLKMAGA